MRTATASEVPEQSVRSARTIWKPMVDQCLGDPEHRLIAEPGVDFKPGDYEGLRKKVHGIATRNGVKAHTQVLDNGSVAFWFYRPEEERR